MYNVTQVSYRQVVCLEAMPARANATVRFAGFGAVTLGALLGACWCVWSGSASTMQTDVQPQRLPAEALAPWDVEAVHPDAFLEAQIDLAPEVVYAEIQRIADSWKNPPARSRT
ncbi:hypothetical protein NKH18_15865 [Streptomyces sp. M10(2022)]